MAWLINQAKPSQAKLNSSLLAFPQAQAQTLFLGLSQTQVKLEFLIFPNESSLNMHYSINLGSFTTLPMATPRQRDQFPHSRLFPIPTMFIKTSFFFSTKIQNFVCLFLESHFSWLEGSYRFIIIIIIIIWGQKMVAILKLALTWT